MSRLHGTSRTARRRASRTSKSLINPLMSVVDPDEEPSASDLAAIDHEWPLIAAELDLLDAEITLLTADDVSELDWHRHRRAARRVARVAVSLGLPGTGRATADRWVA